MTEPRNLLTDLGFRQVVDFQRAYNLGPQLAPDGIIGPLTTAAINRCHTSGGLISPHFHAAEFSCHCKGRLGGCHLTVVRRPLLQQLENYRERWSRTGVRIVSGYRCPAWNREQDGAAMSQHVFGTGADVDPVVPHGTLIDSGLFSGIGWDRTTGKVSHVDVRHVMPAAQNPGGGTLLKPDVWRYNR